MKYRILKKSTFQFTGFLQIWSFFAAKPTEATSLDVAQEMEAKSLKMQLEKLQKMKREFKAKHRSN